MAETCQGTDLNVESNVDLMPKLGFPPVHFGAPVCDLNFMRLGNLL